MPIPMVKSSIAWTRGSSTCN